MGFEVAGAGRERAMNVVGRTRSTVRWRLGLVLDDFMMWFSSSLRLGHFGWMDNGAVT